MNARWQYAGLIGAGAAAGALWSLSTTPGLTGLVYAGFALPVILPRHRGFAHGFTAVPSRWLYVISGAAATASLGSAYRLFHDATQFAIMRRVETGLAALYLPVALVFAAVALAELWRPPTVTLTPEGIVRPQPFRTTVTRWDDLPGPVTVTGGRLQTVLNLGDPRRRIDRGWLTTDVAYLAEAIEHYRVHPEHRPAIGTPEERARLDWALAAPAGNSHRAAPG